MHIFKSVGYRKLANIRKSMQIRKPVVPKKIKKNAFPFFLVKWVYHKLYIYFSISNFWYKLTQPVMFMYRTVAVVSNTRPGQLKSCIVKNVTGTSNCSPEASLIVLDLTSSVHSSSCNYLFILIIFSFN